MISGEEFKVENSMPWELELELVSSLDVMITLIQSDADGNEVNLLKMDEEEADSPLEESEESSNSIIVDSKESRNFLRVENVKKGLESIPLLKWLEGLREKSK